jgi:hypothetical protein
MDATTSPLPPAAVSASSMKAPNPVRWPRWRRITVWPLGGTSPEPGSPPANLARSVTTGENVFVSCDICATTNTGGGSSGAAAAAVGAADVATTEEVGVIEWCRCEESA